MNVLLFKKNQIFFVLSSWNSYCSNVNTNIIFI